MPDPQTVLPPPAAPAGLLPHQPPRRSLLPVLLLLVLLALLAIAGIVWRVHAANALRERTDESALPTVTVMEVAAATATEEVVLPGNAQAWHDAVIYARTSGYLKEWKVEIGTPVKAGQLLAEIEAPEVDAQARQAAADLNTAKANNDLAQVTAKRWVSLVKSDSVSKQDADTKVATAAADQAAVASSQANLEHLQELGNFEKVVAPFDGIITNRTTDNGALINAGNATGQALFEIADTSKLRVYVQVPETYAAAIKPGLIADVVFAGHTARYPATLNSSADALDPTSRTLLIQLEMANKDNVLLAGSYAEVHLKLPSNPQHVHLPVNTLLFRSAGLQVATVDDDNKAHLHAITIARDYGKEVELSSGIEAGAKIIINPPDSLSDGDEVKIASPDDDKQDGGKKE